MLISISAWIITYLAVYRSAVTGESHSGLPFVGSAFFFLAWVFAGYAPRVELLAVLILELGGAILLWYIVRSRKNPRAKEGDGSPP